MIYVVNKLVKFVTIKNKLNSEKTPTKSIFYAIFLGCERYSAVAATCCRMIKSRTHGILATEPFSSVAQAGSAAG